MSLGSMARVVLGKKFFPVVGSWYRAVFVDLEKVVDCLPSLPPGSQVLDIGGGDGEMINILLRRSPELAITMLDLSPRLGLFLKPEFRARVRVLPSTSVAAYASTEYKVPNLVIISDVIHHVPVKERAGFFADLRTVLRGQASTLFIKDLEPGYFRANLSLLADRYVSGDKTVSLVSRETVTALVREVFPKAEARETKLFAIDGPNYALTFSVGSDG
jgi:cyclopropane fatty-acyl-phospholipid synthase-like methyltransferase